MIQGVQPPVFSLQGVRADSESIRIASGITFGPGEVFPAEKRNAQESPSSLGVRYVKCFLASIIFLGFVAATMAQHDDTVYRPGPGVLLRKLSVA